VAFGGGKLVTTNGAVEIYYNPSGTTTTTINDVATTVKDYTHSTDYSGNINLSGEGALTSYMLVNNVNELQAVNLNMGGNYALGGDIDAGSTAIWNPDGSGGYSGFTPLLGKDYQAFTGVFDGGGHTIRNLYINRPATNDVGLFSYSRGAISNLGLKDGNIAGKIDVGGLVGANFGTVSDSYNTGEVRGTKFYVGGLAGYNSGDILRSYNTGNVSSNQGQVGGLIGMNYGNLVDSHNIGIVSSQVDINSNIVGGLVGNNYGHITTSYNTGSVSASSWGAGGIAGENDGSIINSYNSGAITGGVPSCGQVGGLAGLNDGGLITNSYNTGVVNSTKYVGGLVGNSDNGGGIIGSFNTGVVSGSESSVGGLVGYNGDADSGDYILNSYNTGSVRGESNVGGLVGWNWGSITNSYNTGLVSGSISSSTGGLVGYYQETIITIVNSYWDIKTSGTTRGVGIDRSFDHLGRTTAEMMTQSNYSQADGEWDFTNVWGMIDGVSYPYLKCFYQDTPQVISGTVSFGGGQTVQTVLNGTALSSVATGANGFYYMLFTNGTIADHDALLAYVDNGDGNGNAVYGVSGVNASITGLDITADTVSVDSDTPSLALANLLTAAKGSFTGDDILYDSTNTWAVITGNLTVNGVCDISGEITTSGSQTYTGAVTLNGDRTLTSGATVTFGSTVTGDNHMLTVAEYNSSGGNAVFHGDVTGLSALQVDGAGGIGGAITTSGNQIYTGAVNLTEDSILSGTTVTFGDTVGGDFALRIAGNAEFGGNADVASVNMSGTATLDGDIITTGDQTYTGAIMLDGSRTLSADGSITFNGSVTASGAVEIRGADGISINQALNANGDAVNLTTDGGEIRQSETGVITAASLTLATEDSDNGTYGAIYLDSAGNQITTLSGTTGNLFLQDRCDLTLDTITASGDLRVSVPNATLIVNEAVSAAAIMITARNGLTIGSSGSVTASDGNVTLATTGGHFINHNTASDAVGAPSGRWLIYSIGLTGDQRGNLDYNFSQYHTSYGGGVLGTGNGFIYADNLTLTAGLTGPVTKTYDGTATAEVTAAEVTVSSDLTNAQYRVNIEDGSYYADQDAGAGKNVTTGTVTVTGVTDSRHKTVYGYSYTPVNLTADVGVINKAALSVTANDAIWYFGRTEPMYDATYSGWAGDDTAAILGTLNYTTTYDGALGGKYAIKVSGPAATTNYTVSYYDGVLTVTPVFNSKYIGALVDLSNARDRVNTDWGETGDTFNLQIIGQGINRDGVRPAENLE
jgi:hypothetical protein